MSELVCSVCRKAYKSRAYYEKHLKLHAEGSATVKLEKVKKEKPILECTYCGKEYKTQKGLSNHLLTHIQAAAGNKEVANDAVKSDELNPLTHDDDDDDSELWPEDAELQEKGEEIFSFFEDEDEEQEALLLSSIFNTPYEKKPVTASKTPKTPLALCSVCGNGYLTLDGFIKHRMSHAMQDSLSKAPSLHELNIQLSKMSSEVLRDIISCNQGGSSRLENQLTLCSSKLLENISSDHSQAFLSSLTEGLYACFSLGSKFLLPSHLREAFMKGCAILQANKEKKEELSVKVVLAMNSEECGSDINFFLTTFIRKFSLKLLASVVHWMVHGENSPIVQSEKLYMETKQSLDTVDFKQTLHYTAGANVKSVLRNAWRKWSGHEDAKAVIKTLRQNFLIGDAKDAPDKDFMEWTLCQDRGKLIKINDLALSFFFELATVVKPMEHFDGSLYVEEVIEKVASYPKLIYLWEELVKDTLPKHLQFKLLHSLCSYFCNTWRSGIVSRRRDELHSSKLSQTLGTSGVAFRAKVVKYH